MQQRRGGKARGLVQDSQDSAAPMVDDNQIDLDVNLNPRLWGSESDERSGSPKWGTRTTLHSCEPSPSEEEARSCGPPVSWRPGSTFGSISAACGWGGSECASVQCLSAQCLYFFILYFVFFRLRRSVPVPLQVDFDYGLPDLIHVPNLETFGRDEYQGGRQRHGGYWERDGESREAHYQQGTR